MSLEGFQLLDNTAFDYSIVQRDFSKNYHQRGAQFNDPNRNTEFIFGENKIYHQSGNA